MAYFVDVPDVEILPDLQEDEAARMLLLLAHDEGTIDDEELLLLNFALDEDLKETSSKAAIKPGEKFDLDTESEGSCISMFRFTKEEIRRLCVLLQFPGPTMSKYHVSWTTEEGLCIVLRRLAYPCRLDDLVPIFGRWKQDLSIIINSVCTHICSTWSRLLTDFSHAAWYTPERLQAYSDAVSRRCPLSNCWGFIDGTVRAIFRPSVAQKPFYNGHKRYHGLNYQTIATPDGLIAHMYGPVEGCRHDSGMLRESGLCTQLEQLPLAPDGGIYCIYGDPAYPLRPQLLAPFKGANLTEEQQEFNKQMSAVRVSVEWAYAKVVQLFAFVDFKKNLKLLLQPIATYYYVAVLLTNCHTCLRGNETSKLFGVNPPTLEEYLA